MDSEELAGKLAAFDAAMSDEPYPAPRPGEWGAEMILAHAATVNRLVAVSVASVIGAEPVAYSNRLAGSEPLLRALVAETGGVPELRADVLRTGRVLVRLATDLGPAAGTPVQTRIAEGDHVIVDGPVPALALIGSALGYHLGVHREQLAALGGVPATVGSPTGTATAATKPTSAVAT